MKNREYGFVELFDKIDTQLVKEAEGEWEKEKKEPFFHGNLAKAACAAICVSIGAACLFQPQVKAAIREFTGWIARIWQVEDDLAPYTEVIEKKKTIDNFSLCLDEVILSDNKIYAAVTIDTDYPEGTVIGGIYITINGIDYPVENVYDQSEDIGQNLGEQVPHHVYTFTLKDGKIPENVTNMELHFLAYRNYEDLLEEKNEVAFDIAFSATKEELQKNVIDVTVDKAITLMAGTTIKLKSLTLTKLDSRIEAELENIPDNKKDGDMMYDGYLEGWDSLGNPVGYICYTTNGKDITFVCDMQNGLLPSVDSEWVELQYYYYEKVDEKDQWPIDTVDGEDMVMEDDGIPVNRVDAGEPFRIEIVQDDPRGE